MFADTSFPETSNRQTYSAILESASLYASA